MAEQNQQPEDEDLQAPEELVEALNKLQKERIFVPQAVDHAMLMRARQYLRRLEGPQSGWKPWLSWAAMAACLALAVWLGVRFSNPTGAHPFAREDINRDGRVDVLDAFALARQINTGGTLDLRWDINGDGRVDGADVNAIAARAVSLAQAGPAPKRSADRRRISNKTTLTLTLSRPTGEGTARPVFRSFHSGWRRRQTHGDSSSSIRWERAGPSPRRPAATERPRGESGFVRAGGVRVSLPQNSKLFLNESLVRLRVNVLPASCRQVLQETAPQHASENREDRS